MADIATPTPPAAPVATPAPAPAPAPASIPEPPQKLTVPASALGLELPERPAKPAAEPAKPAEPSPTPAAQKPNEPAKGVDPNAPATPPAEPKPAEQKVKIGGKEYTVAELEKLVAKPAPAPKPAAEAPKPSAPAPLTEAQIAAQKAEVSKQEQAWVDNFIQKESINFVLSEDDMETILSGGKGAVELLGKTLANVASRSALLARKSMYEDLEPMIANLDKTLAPLLGNFQQVSRVSAEQQFIGAFPEFKDHMDTVREMASALEKQFPEQVAKMTQEQFAQEVAAQVDNALQAEYKRWFPGATNTWKDARAAAAAPAPAPSPAPAPAAPAAPAKPKIQPPAGSSPAAIPAVASPDFHKSVAKDLCD